MAANVEELKQKYKNASADNESKPDKKDRGIKGTLIDDYALEIAMKLLALLAILVIGSILYLWLERTITTKFLTPWRIWLPVVGWVVLAFLQKPFLRFGWWGILCTLAVIPTVSGYLWQLFQGLVGTR